MGHWWIILVLYNPEIHVYKHWFIQALKYISTIFGQGIVILSLCHSKLVLKLNNEYKLTFSLFSINMRVFTGQSSTRWNNAWYLIPSGQWRLIYIVRCEWLCVLVVHLLSYQPWCILMPGVNVHCIGFWQTARMES